MVLIKKKLLTVAGFFPKGASALKTFLGELIDTLFLSFAKIGWDKLYFNIWQTFTFP